MSSRSIAFTKAASRYTGRLVTQGRTLDVHGAKAHNRASVVHHGIVILDVTKLGSKCVEEEGEKREIPKEEQKTTLKSRVGFELAASRYVGHLVTQGRTLPSSRCTGHLALWGGMLVLLLFGYTADRVVRL